MDSLSPQDHETGLTRWIKSPAGTKALAAFYAFSLGIVLLGLWNDFRVGGNSWVQGDWLINAEAAHVRRGIMGSLVLRISDLLGLGPVAVVCLIQAGLAVTLYALIWQLIQSVGSGAIRLLLSVSTGFVPVFWAGDLSAGLRKEMLAMIAILLLLQAMLRGRNWLLWSAISLYLFSCVAHELNILMAPFIAGLLCIVGVGPVSIRTRLSATLVSLLGAVAAYVYAQTNSIVPDVSTICAPLLARDVAAQICDGAIAWLDRTSADAVISVQEQILHPRPIATVAIGYALSFAPISIILRMIERPLPILVLIVLTGLPFAPLYGLAVDWGRWMSLHVFSVACLFAFMAITQQIRTIRPPIRLAVIVLSALPFIYIPGHVWIPVEGGMLTRLHREITSLRTQPSPTALPAQTE